MTLETVVARERVALLPSEELYEVVNGEKKEVPPMGALAGTLASILVTLINGFAFPRRLGFGVVEVLFQLLPDRPQRRPDLAFVAFEGWTPPPPGVDPPAWEVVPRLAVEVVSPTNSAVEVEEKLRDYFAAGVRLVWVIYPMFRRVYVHESLTQVRVLEENGELDGGAVLPGFRTRIADLFTTLTPPQS